MNNFLTHWLWRTGQEFLSEIAIFTPLTNKTKYLVVEEFDDKTFHQLLTQQTVMQLLNYQSKLVEKDLEMLKVNFDEEAIKTEIKSSLKKNIKSKTCEVSLRTGAFEIRSDPCSTHILGISGHRPKYFREASISSIMKVSWTKHCVFSYVLKECTSWK